MKPTTPLKTTLLTLLLGLTPPTHAQTLNIVAHQDDDLLFLSPDLHHEIQSGRRVRTLYLTTGDAGDSPSTLYYEQRQSGSQAAYARMASAQNTWAQSSAPIPGKNIPMFTLSSNPDISLLFMQLPDGNLAGDGFATTGSVSLQMLWEGGISSIASVNGSSTYTSQEIVDTLTGIMEDFGPDRINTGDYEREWDGKDHSDHVTVGHYVQEAAKGYGGDHVLMGYTGYPVAGDGEDVGGQGLGEKQMVFYEYAGHDVKVCRDVVGCGEGNEAQWMKRQY
ncbi:hypothetical protein BO71DRAFT_391884, partial [Aspergillus ellipticus CBS 707.79]